MPFGNGRFFYTGTDLLGYLPLGAPFTATYASPASSVTWSFPSSCSVVATAPPSWASVNVTCLQPGEFAASVYRDNDPTTTDDFYINIRGCYSWYAVSALNPTYVVDSQYSANQPIWNVIRIWITDYTASDAERQLIAMSPSQTSAALTAEFQSMGENPVPLIPDMYNISISMVNYLQSGRYWEVNFTNPIPPGIQFPVFIYSTNVTILGCKVASSFREFSYPKFLSLASNDNLFAPTTASPTTSLLQPFQVSSDPCSKNQIVALSSNVFAPNRVFISQNGANSLQTTILSDASYRGLFKVTPLADDSLAWVTVTKSGFVFLPVNSTFLPYPVVELDLINLQYDSALTTLKSSFSDSLSDLTFISQPSGLSSSSSSNASPQHILRQIRRTSACELIQAIDGLDDPNTHALAAWSTDSVVPSASDLAMEGLGQFSAWNLNSYTGAEVWWSFNDGLSWMRSVVGGDAVFVRKVWAVEPVVGYSGGIGLFRDSNGMDWMASWSLNDNIWNWGHSWTSNLPLDGRLKGCSPNLVASGAGSKEILIWCDSLWFSPNLGISAHPITLVNRDPTISGTSLGTLEYISSVVTSLDGKYAVLTSTNRVFVGALSTPNAFEIEAGILPSAVVALYFDSLNSLYVLEPLSSDLSSRLLPYYTQLTGTRDPVPYNPPLTCPYWNVNETTQDVNYLDIGENFTINANYESLTSAGDISFICGDLNKVTCSVSTSISITGVANLQQMTASVTVNTSSTRQSGDNIGSTEMRLALPSANLACPVIERISRINVGCPPTRYMIVSLPQPNDGSADGDFCASLVNNSVPITINAGTYADPPGSGQISQNDKVILYNYTQFGCPISNYYSDALNPSLLYYDGDQLVNNVTALFVVWEVNGRVDFSYSLTVASAGCTAEPYFWSDAIAADPSDPFSAFAPTYKNCMQDQSGIGNISSRPYEMLSAGSQNGLSWGSDNGFYLYAVKVIDPDFSYCNLTAYFAVRVYGTPLDPLTQGLIIGGMILGLILALVASFFLTRWFKIKQKQKVY